MKDKDGNLFWELGDNNTLLFKGDEVGIVGRVNGKLKVRIDTDHIFDLGREEVKALDGFILFLSVMTNK